MVIASSLVENMEPYVMEGVMRSQNIALNVSENAPAVTKNMCAIIAQHAVVSVKHRIARSV